MAYSVEWLDQPNIILMKIIGKVEEEECTAIVEAWASLAQQEPDALVHTLMDISEMKTFTNIRFMVSEINRVINTAPNRAPSTIYGLNKLTRFFVETLLRLTSIRLKMFNDREQALAFLYDMIAQEKIDAESPQTA